MTNEEVKVEEITNEAQRCELGEGPHWDIERQSLYYVNILEEGAIFRFDFKTKEIYKARIKDDDSPIGFIVPVEGIKDEFIVGAKRNVLLIRWDGRSSQATSLRVLAEVDKETPGNRINDGKVDPKGALFFGTMGDETTLNLNLHRNGRLYSFSNKTALKPWKDTIGISNGLTWDKERKKFYYIDSVARDIKAYDYDSKTSSIGNETVLIDFNKTHAGEEFVGDGMTIDENGTLYVATWNGGRILVIDPDTKDVTREIPMPTPQITSLAFGGPNLEYLFATSAGKPKPKPAPAGGLFMITGLGVKGLPMHAFKLY